MSLTFLTSSAAETEEVALQLAHLLRPGDTIALKGDLGAGKTTFVRGIARALNADVPATSPTFSLINHLPGNIPIIHMDAYRLASSNDLYDLGFYDLAVDSAVLIVEWADRIIEALSENCILVEITPINADSDERHISISSAATPVMSRIDALKGIIEHG